MDSEETLESLEDAVISLNGKLRECHGRLDAVYKNRRQAVDKRKKALDNLRGPHKELRDLKVTTWSALHKRFSKYGEVFGKNVLLHFKVSDALFDKANSKYKDLPEKVVSAEDILSLEERAGAPQEAIEELMLWYYGFGVTGLVFNYVYGKVHGSDDDLTEEMLDEAVNRIKSDALKFLTKHRPAFEAIVGKAEGLLEIYNKHLEEKEAAESIMSQLSGEILTLVKTHNSLVKKFNETETKYTAVKASREAQQSYANLTAFYSGILSARSLVAMVERGREAKLSELEQGLATLEPVSLQLAAEVGSLANQYQGVQKIIVVLSNGNSSKSKQIRQRLNLPETYTPVVRADDVAYIRNRILTAVKASDDPVKYIRHLFSDCGHNIYRSEADSFIRGLGQLNGNRASLLIARENVERRISELKGHVEVYSQSWKA